MEAGHSGMLRWFGIFMLLVLIPLSHTLTLDDYFKLLALVAKKRDMWRKIFYGNDIGFEMSPWLFKDRVKPPYVPLINTFPRYPKYGHYENEKAPLQPLLYSAQPVSPPPAHIPPPVTPPTYHIPTSTTPHTYHIPAPKTTPPTYHIPAPTTSHTFFPISKRQPRKNQYHYRMSYPFFQKYPYQPLKRIAKKSRGPRILYSWG